MCIRDRWSSFQRAIGVVRRGRRPGAALLRAQTTFHQPSDRAGGSGPRGAPPGRMSARAA
eukprot:11196178-Lingulodinium_polyedra.AAC.2